MNLPKRKQLRLPEYDYSAPGAYFVTVCTQDRRCILSEIRRGRRPRRPAPDPNGNGENRGEIYSVIGSH